VSVLVIAFFSFAVLAASAFAIAPVLRGAARGRWLLAAALVLFVGAIGGGTYLMIGRPALAVRALQKPSIDDLNTVIAPLVADLHRNPNDAPRWAMLGKIYLDRRINDPEDAAKALARAIEVSRAEKAQSAELYSTYGEAIVRLSSGAVPAEAEAAFAQALRLDPKDQAARYFLGFAYAARGEKAKAIALWQSLLADAPANASYREELIDRIAALSASSGAAPDINAMVAGLAARLKTQPDDAQGWQRLIRAYAVLGDNAKASAALRDARVAMARNPQVLTALRAEAIELRLEK
jgi:cytochrome c-type biogenesis protein CcmH